MAKINRQEINKRIADGYISAQQHPDHGQYWILNYTHKCQYDQAWDEYTVMCRGLIVDSLDNILWRPFPKFFNLQEHIEKGGVIPNEKFTVSTKYDGSLGILYWIGDTKYLATRGSFTSDQAIEGTKILREKYDHYDFNRDLTYLFEIIYPENRIVVDYKGVRSLVLLDVIDPETGKSVMGKVIQGWDILTAEQHEFTTLKQIEEAEQRDNAEGYVIKFELGLRLKVKFDEYVRLHRLITGVTSKTIWEFLRDGKTFDELIQHVPDEYYQWIKETERSIQLRYAEIEGEYKEIFAKLSENPGLEDRKSFALEAQGFEHPGILFSMLDNKDYSAHIWKLVRPETTKPFREDIDA